MKILVYIIEKLKTLAGTFNPGKTEFARPYDSTNGISQKGQLTILIVFLVFVVVTIAGVWKSLRDENRNRK